MCNFEELGKETNFEMNQRISKYWKDHDIFNKSIDTKDKNKNFVFYDGPIYANAKPGLHHMFAKEIKDSFCRYKTMQGYRVLRKMGLDTHGLPIEVNVEKKLGFESKADIEKFGIDKFNHECRKATQTNIGDVIKLTDMMGQFIDTDNPYITCSNDYIETEWWIINELNKKGLLYQGNKVLPYCPRCGTELANFEVAQGYKEVSVNTVIVPFKLKEENTYVLVWTTTPWTLIANLGLCVNPDEDYIKVESKGYKFIVAKALANNVLGDEYEVLETFKGKTLENKEYEQLMPFIEVKDKAFIITCDNYVTMEDGTGIVHLAPAYGDDDNRVCKKYGITFINPVGKDGRYTVGPWEGRIVTDPELEIDIIKYLKENDKLFKKIKIKHDYPHCWRCKQPLLYYAKPAWYIANTEYKDEILAINRQIHWHPSYVGEKRFANWLENMIDWGISRNRFWGAPLPVWTCSCGHFKTIGSIEELKNLSISKLKDEEIDLHRPYVDNIHIKCDKCGKEMSRVADVLDVWFDSGCMPYSQYHYPFENKELFESQFPADFIAEGIDQTRGWFYVLLVISSLISGKAPYKNVLVNDLMLDANGKKMSKSLGNIVEPFTTIEKYGADIIRYYLLNVSPVWTPLKFDYKGVEEVASKFYNTLKNTYNFFAIYANADKVNPREFNVDYNDLTEIDKWLFSKYHKLIKNVTFYMENYDLTRATIKIGEFISEDLSNWYIRRNRRRFWSSKLDIDKKAVYYTTYNVLEGLCCLVAPIAPFISEDIYIKLTNKESVHLAQYPQYNEKYINENIEQRMDLVRNLISLGRNIREEVKIKVRQPISECLIDGKNEKLISDLLPLIEEELNVKKVTFITDLSNYMNYTVKPNFKEVGKIFGSSIKAFSNELLTLTTNDIIKLQNNEVIKMTIDGTVYNVDINYVDIRTTSKEGFDVASDTNNFVILNTELTDELILEGIAREIISKIQNLRKTNDFDIVDRIDIYYNGDDKVNEAIKQFEDFIKRETLALHIIQSDKKYEEFDLNGHLSMLGINKIK